MSKKSSLTKAERKARRVEREEDACWNLLAEQAKQERAACQVAKNVEHQRQVAALMAPPKKPTHRRIQPRLASTHRSIGGYRGEKLYEREVRRRRRDAYALQFEQELKLLV